jgi:chromate transporter
MRQLTSVKPSCHVQKQAWQTNRDNLRMDLIDLEPKQEPQSLLDLFVTFTVLALQGFGGVLAVAQSVLVERKRWMTKEEFVEEWSVAQIMPGPNIINLCIMFGRRHFGLKGALVSMAGMLLVPLLLLLIIALFYAQYASHPGVSGALRGMGAVTAGLIAATGLKLLPALYKNALGLGTCIAFVALCFVAVALLHWPLAYVLLGLGSIACALAYRRLAP